MSNIDEINLDDVNFEYEKFDHKNYGSKKSTAGDKIGSEKINKLSASPEKPQKSKNSQNNTINNDDIYLETSIHNPFLHSTNSRINSNTKFTSFMRSKIEEINKPMIFSEKNFKINNKNQKVLLSLIDLDVARNTSIEELVERNSNFVEVFLKVDKNSIVAFNIKTNFDLYSGDYFPIIYLNFNSVSAEMFLNENLKTIKICVLGSEKLFLFRFDTKSYFNTFSFILKEIISESLGNKSNLLGFVLRKNFYKFYTLKVGELLSKAKTGDLLLFRGRHNGAKCQRCFTGAHYDHAALLIKRYECVEMYDATSFNGCKVRQLTENFFTLNDFLYDKIIYRELKFPEEDGSVREEFLVNVQKKLEDFLAKTRGSGYRLPCSIICCPGKKTYERYNNWGEAKGFFCSQLVAAAYMNFGVLSYDKSSASYLPGKLSQTESIPFVKGYNLGPEYIIDNLK